MSQTKSGQRVRQVGSP